MRLNFATASVLVIACMAGPVGFFGWARWDLRRQWHDLRDAKAEMERMEIRMGAEFLALRAALDTLRSDLSREHDDDLAKVRAEVEQCRTDLRRHRELSTVDIETLENVARGAGILAPNVAIISKLPPSDRGIEVPP